MKPFDLEKAKAGHKLVTRDGREVLDFYCFDLASPDCVWVCYAVIDGDVQGFDRDGYFNRCGESSLDLMLASTKRKGFVNVYVSSDPIYAGVFDTEKEAQREADRHGRSAVVTAVPIEWEE